ncbi:uncharacterized protein G2W53_019817 [Senna tora]|uniref:Uncharacterized protein n=1 Tax=Senna tora TaxID=362788 RepID=A0A834TUZ8_9FABA|nr:uncharacterized protein G2W53_019817 [Senna tora]
MVLLPVRVRSPKSGWLTRLLHRVHIRGLGRVFTTP